MTSLDTNYIEKNISELFNSKLKGVSFEYEPTAGISVIISARILDILGEQGEKKTEFQTSEKLSIADRKNITLEVYEEIKTEIELYKTTINNIFYKKLFEQLQSNTEEELILPEVHEEFLLPEGTPEQTNEVSRTLSNLEEYKAEQEADNIVAPHTDEGVKIIEEDVKQQEESLDTIQESLTETEAFETILEKVNSFKEVLRNIFTEKERKEFLKELVEIIATQENLSEKRRKISALLEYIGYNGKQEEEKKAKAKAYARYKLTANRGMYSFFKTDLENLLSVIEKNVLQNSNLARFIQKENMKYLGVTANLDILSLPKEELELYLLSLPQTEKVAFYEAVQELFSDEYAKKKGDSKLLKIKSLESFTRNQLKKIIEAQTGEKLPSHQLKSEIDGFATTKTNFRRPTSASFLVQIKKQLLEKHIEQNRTLSISSTDIPENSESKGLFFKKLIKNSGIDGKYFFEEISRILAKTDKDLQASIELQDFFNNLLENYYVTIQIKNESITIPFNKDIYNKNQNQSEAITQTIKSFYHAISEIEKGITKNKKTKDEVKKVNNKLKQVETPTLEIGKKNIDFTSLEQADIEYIFGAQHLEKNTPLWKLLSGKSLTNIGLTKKQSQKICQNIINSFFEIYKETIEIANIENNEARGRKSYNSGFTNLIFKNGNRRDFITKLRTLKEGNAGYDFLRVYYEDLHKFVFRDEPKTFDNQKPRTFNPEIQKTDS